MKFLFSNLLCCVVLLTCGASITTAQTMSIREVMEREKDWSEWAKTGKKIHVSGRYEGRVAKQFRLSKWPVIITPARTTVLPNDIALGQRMTISGVLNKSGSRYFMDADRIAVGGTDAERFRARLENIPAETPEAVYPLADEYELIQTFYDDEELIPELAKARADAFAAQRKLYKTSPDKLRKLADSAVALGVDANTIAAIQFESIVQQSQLPNANSDAVIKRIKEILKDWDKPNAFLDGTQEKAFLEDPIQQYETANELSRLRMHRALYRTVRLPQLLKSFKPDGSNGVSVADTIAAELPEETAQIARLKEAYVAYRINDVPRLTRKQLEDLDTLLKEFNREAETKAAVAAWLKAQDARRNNGQLDGMIATADEYLFAFERWKEPDHRNKGVELLKRSWILTSEAAPAEAANISRRLEQYGWTRLDDRWITTEDLANLPKNDIALAMREGRVVEGMKYEQIVNTLGQPSRKVRVVSAGYVQEIWIFGEAGSSSIVVHLKRGRFEAPKEAYATLVAKGAQ